MYPIALIGPTEIWIILGVVVLLFGGRKLPELARAAGSSITQFKKGLKEEPEAIEPPAKKTVAEGEPKA